MEVYKKYGEEGLCYYILHHYLDKIESIVKGRTYRVIFKYLSLPLKDRFSYLPNEVREGLRDEVSTLSFIARDRYFYYSSAPHMNSMEESYYTRYSFYRKYVDEGYSKQTARKKAEARIAVISSCRDVDISDFPQLEDQVLLVRSKLMRDLERVLCIMFSVDKERWLEWWGEQWHSYVMDALRCENYLKDTGKTQ